jgi:hypothetical protein
MNYTSERNLTGGKKLKQQPDLLFMFVLVRGADRE